MNLLIDADYIVYKCCAACETEIDYGEDVIFVTSNFSDAYKAVTNDISKITKQLESVRPLMKASGAISIAPLSIFFITSPIGNISFNAS